MTLKQKNKSGTLLFNKPVAAGLAGFVASTTEDTSSWSTLNGVKQQSGWAVCDGSTLDNSSGKYDDFLARTGSLTLPNGPYRTREVDLNYNLSSLDSGSFTSRFMKGYFYTDDKGNWRLNFTGAFTLDVSDIFFYLRIQNIVGKDFGAGNDDRQYFAVDCPFGGSNDQASGYARGGDNFFRISGVSNQTEYNVAGDILLDSKPTIANFDDYLEATPLIQLVDNVGNAVGVPEATADQAGTVSTGDQVWSGNKEFIDGASGKIFEKLSTVNALSNSTTTVIGNAADGLNGMYMVTCSRGPTGGSYSAASISIVAIVTGSSAVVVSLRSDPDCVITAVGGSVFAQTISAYNGQSFKTTFIPLMVFE